MVCLPWSQVVVPFVVTEFALTDLGLTSHVDLLMLVILKIWVKHAGYHHYWFDVCKYGSNLFISCADEVTLMLGLYQMNVELGQGCS